MPPGSSASGGPAVRAIELENEVLRRKLDELRETVHRLEKSSSPRASKSERKELKVRALTKQIHIAKSEAMKHADLSKEALVGDVGYLYGLLQQAKLERKEHQCIIAQLQGRVVSEREQQRELRALRAADKEAFAQLIRTDRAAYDKSLRRATSAITKRDGALQRLADWAGHQKQELINELRYTQDQLAAARKHHEIETLEKTMVAVRREQSSLDTGGVVSPRIERGEITLPRTTPASVSPGRVSELGDTYGDDFEEDTQGDEDSHRRK